MRLEEKDKISIEEYDRRRINALYEEFISARLRGYGDYPTIVGMNATSFFDKMYSLLEKIDLSSGVRSEILYIINRYGYLIGFTLLAIRPKDRERRVIVPLSGKRFGAKSLSRSRYLEIITLDELLRKEGPEGVIEAEKNFYLTIQMLPDRSREELIKLGREAYVEPVHTNLVTASVDIDEIDRVFVGDKPSETLIPIAAIGPEESLLAYIGFESETVTLGVLPKKLPYPERKFKLYPFIQYVNPTQIVYRKGR